MSAGLRRVVCEACRRVNVDFVETAVVVRIPRLG
jgi:hypothetical protein